MHRQERAPDLRGLAPEVPPGVAQLVQSLLAKEPLRRPQTPEELIDRLVRLEIKTFAHRRWPLAPIPEPGFQAAQTSPLSTEIVVPSGKG